MYNFYALATVVNRRPKLFLYIPTSFSQFLLMYFPIIVAIDAKLSPTWNRMSKYMVRHTDFLTRATVEAVKMSNLSVSENMDHYQVYINLEGIALKWANPVTLHSLDIDERSKGMFIRKEIDVIPRQKLGNQWLCVLPNLTKGRFVSTHPILISNIINSL